MQVKVNNYISPAVDQLENFMDFYDDDKIGAIQIYEWDGTDVLDTTVTAVASLVSDLKDNIVKTSAFLYASVEFDVDLDGTTIEATHVYIVVNDKCIVSLNDTETGVLKYLFETLLDLDTVADMMVAVSNTTTVVLSNTNTGDNATLVTGAENTASNKFNATFNI